MRKIKIPKYVSAQKPEEDDPFAAFGVDDTPTQEDSSTHEELKLLAFKIYKLIEFAQNHSWYSAEPHLKTLEFMEKGYVLTPFQRGRVEKAYMLLVENEHILSPPQVEIEIPKDKEPECTTLT